MLFPSVSAFFLYLFCLRASTERTTSARITLRHWYFSCILSSQFHFSTVCSYKHHGHQSHASPETVLLVPDEELPAFLGKAREEHTSAADEDPFGDDLHDDEQALKPAQRMCDLPALRLAFGNPSVSDLHKAAVSGSSFCTCDFAHCLLQCPSRPPCLLRFC